MNKVINDKTFKTKGDKNRRLREKKQNNNKKFMDEKKHAQVYLNKYIKIILYSKIIAVCVF